MKRVIAILALLASLALVPAAQAGKAVKYEGKTSSGHKVTFTLKGKRVYNLESGIAVSCIPIQGGGSPTGGVETFSYTGWVELGPERQFTFMKTPAFHYNEVTTNHTLSTKLVNPKTGLITGATRIQYEFLIPKYPIGTFAIFSCLGEGTFRAKPIVSK
ncbi:MAG TPA: hypothetical protein VD741_09725 [Solirubrobacterales bacterium]|nr:hypothetical protein [Solirubrobacterales bacterium]